jgi:hypothetical protein
MAYLAMMGARLIEMRRDFRGELYRWRWRH